MNAQLNTPYDMSSTRPSHVRRRHLVLLARAYTKSHECDWKAKKESDTRSLLSPPGTPYSSWTISQRLAAVRYRAALHRLHRTVCCSFYLWFWFFFSFNIEWFSNDAVCLCLRNLSFFFRLRCWVEFIHSTREMPLMPYVHIYLVECGCVHVVGSGVQTRKAPEWGCSFALPGVSHEPCHLLPLLLLISR